MGGLRSAAKGEQSEGAVNTRIIIYPVLRGSDLPVPVQMGDNPNSRRSLSCVVRVWCRRRETERRD